MQLNDLQTKFVDLAVDWFYNSSSSLLQLAGYAGTGKSVVISEVLKRLNLPEDQVLSMAYTGQACTIMRKRGLANACTCHSCLFTPIKERDMDENGIVKRSSTFNTPVTKWKFIPKDFSNTKIKLIIIDEAWMVPKKFRQYIDKTGIKVLAAGDPGQLPPIGDDPGYLVDGDIFFLTDLVRQSSDSPIIYLADKIRNGKTIDTGSYGNTQVIYEDELTNELLKKADITLCAKNVKRDQLNRKIRQDILKHKSMMPMFRERVICRKNNWDKQVYGIPLVNGLVGTIINSPGIAYFTGETIRIDFLPDLVSEPFFDLDINYKYLCADYGDRVLLSKNPYFKGETFEYAYASTVHLSQGSEYSSGVYIEEYMGKAIQNALNYTAITRFKDSLIYVKPKPNVWVNKKSY